MKQREVDAEAEAQGKLTSTDHAWVLNLSMMDEQKEMAMTLKELRQEIVGLKRRNLDRSKWRQWDSEQVLMFIMSSVDDDSLKQYEEGIKEEVIGGEYAGEDLADISLAQIKNVMGIIKIKPRKAVFRAIQELVNGLNQQRHQHLPADEGVDAAAAPTAYLK